MKGSIEVRVELGRALDGKWGVTLTMPRSLCNAVLDEWRAKRLYMVSSGGPVDASTCSIVLGIDPTDVRSETCEAESQGGGYLGKMKCVLMKGHYGSHTTKEGTLWAPASTDRVDANGVTREPWLQRFVHDTVHVMETMNLPDRLEVLKRINKHFNHGPKSSESPVSSETVACDRSPHGWVCTRARGHEGPCATVHPSVLDPETPAQRMGFDRPEPYTRDRFNARATHIMARGGSWQAVVAGLKDVYWEAWEESKRAAKAEWGEAIEETDKSRAFRVLTILNDFPRDRGAQEKILAEEFAEVRAVESRARATMDAAMSAAAAVQAAERHNATFLDELERHRKAIEEMMPAPEGTTAWMHTLRDAVWFLLAVAHQP